MRFVRRGHCCEQVRQTCTLRTLTGTDWPSKNRGVFSSRIGSEELSHGRLGYSSPTLVINIATLGVEAPWV